MSGLNDVISDRFISFGDTILGRDCMAPCDGRVTRLNNNCLVVGPPGSGKTRGYIEPNIMGLGSSYIVNDPKGNLYEKYAPGLRAAGYDVKILDFVRTERSNTRWNPFAYVKNESSRLSLCEALISADGVSSLDPFWFQTSTRMTVALSLLAEGLRERASERPVATVRDILELANLLYEDSRLCSRGGRYDAFGYSAADELFDDLRLGTRHGRWYRDGEAHDAVSFEELVDSSSSASVAAFDPQPNCAAVRSWLQVRNAAEKTFKSILASYHAALSKTSTDEFLELTDDSSIPTIDFGELGRRPSALFVIVSDRDRMLDPYLGVFFSQAISALADVADFECADNDNRLHVPVRIVIDDCGCIGRIPKLEDWLGSMRSRDIWISIVLQHVSQLQAKYGYEAARTIIGCCDQALFTGFTDRESIEEFSALSGVPAERVRKTRVGQEWVCLRGRNAEKCDVYDPRDHPNFTEFELARFREDLEAFLGRT